MNRTLATDLLEAAPRAEPNDRRGTGTAGRVLRALLRARLFYKILIANAVLIVLATAAGAASTLYANGAAEPHVQWLTGSFAVIGIVLSVTINALIIRIALHPLERLESVAAAVRSGDVEARAPVSPLADRDLERLIRAFNEMLDRLLLYRRRLRSMAARALDSAEEERRRIARDLHDHAAQSLATLMLRLRIARASSDEAERDRLLDELRADLAAAVEGMRGIAHGLRPPALEMLGLVPAIASYGRKLEEGGGIEVVIEADAMEHALPPQTELALYRIVQEALSNVARHARAGRARVTLRRLPEQVVVAIEDAGRGFSVEDIAADPERGLGLFGMEERAMYIGGHLTIDSEPGRGTRVVVEVPIDFEAATLAHAM